MPSKPPPRRGAPAALASLATIVAAACRDPAPRPAPHTDVPAPQGDVRPPRGPRGAVDLSPPGAVAAGATTLAWGRAGVAAAWVEGDAVRAWQRAGARWTPLGARLNEHPPAGPLRVVGLGDDTLAAAWTERGPTGAAVRLAQWQGGRWASLGGTLNEPSAATAVTTVVVSGRAQAPLVAMILEGAGPNPTTLRAVRWTGARWENAGPPSLVPPGARVQTLSGAGCADGRSLLGWVEISTAGTPTLELREWSPQQNTWVALPRADSPLVDAGTHTLAMHCDDAGALSVGYGWSGGTHGVRRWDTAAEAWEDLGLPRADLRGAVLDAGPWIAWQGETLWMAWRPQGGRLTAAVRRAGAWRVLSEALDERGSRGAALALDPTGTLYASSRGPSARVSVASIARE